jgi:hypothetical protein
MDTRIPEAVSKLLTIEMTVINNGAYHKSYYTRPLTYLSTPGVIMLIWKGEIRPKKSNLRVWLHEAGLLSPVTPETCRILWKPQVH